MGDSERGRSPELDRVRQMLFPDIPPDAGWARIDEAVSGASDDERWEKIERLAGADLSGDLLTRLRELRDAEDETDEE